MDVIREIESRYKRKEPLPEFNVGDLVDVHVRIKEGDKERIQVFSGTVIKIKGRKGINGTFTVRRIVAGEGVERVFPYHSPFIRTVKVKRRGRVRRAKLYYLRDRVGKATKVKERRDARASRAEARAKAREAEKEGGAEGREERLEEPVA